MFSILSGLIFTRINIVNIWEFRKLWLKSKKKKKKFREKSNIDCIVR